ncbi:MAG: bacillithiol biosynthesis deacetylase BshB1 [Bacteroidetes bacterium]|nr:bacillithiol biosynthesis deacetylase BshB1 [Bacteroidota bacterium]
MKLDILAFAAHPDDVELAASGTVIKHIQSGYQVGIVDLTRGELGSRGSATIRDAEAAEAAKFMKLATRVNLALNDGFFENNKDNQLAIIEQIRQFRPNIVLCNATSDRHPDHGKAGDLVSKACFLSGLVKIETDQPAWRPKAVYHYIQDRYLPPDFVVDITDQMDQKLEAIQCFKSQFYNPYDDSPETPISSLAFLEFIKARAREMGRQANFEFAEGFTVERFIGVKDLFDLI